MPTRRKNTSMKKCFCENVKYIVVLRDMWNGDLEVCFEDSLERVNNFLDELDRDDFGPEHVQVFKVKGEVQQLEVLEPTGFKAVE